MVDINTGIVAVKFEASWCAHCKPVGKTLNTLSTEFPKVTIQAIDIEDDPQIAKKYQIRSLPTVILLREGQEIRRFVGRATLKEFREGFRNLAEDRAA